MTTISKIEQYQKEVIAPFLPNSMIGDWIEHGSDVRLHLHEFQLFKNSIFEITERNIDYLHFTSISNLVQILNNKSFLLSDLNLFSDNNEFNFANKSIDDFWNNLKYEDLKSQLFALSMCEFNHENLHSKQMWELYASNNKGVCIRFHIKQDSLIYNTFLGRIQYHGDKPIDELVKIRARHEEFKERNNWCISNLADALAIISSLYKLNKYSYENEIRLLKFLPKSIEDPHLDHDVLLNYSNDLNKIRYRYILPIEDNNTPLISIKEIYLKDTFENPLFGQIHNYLKVLLDKKFKHRIKITDL